MADCFQDSFLDQPDSLLCVSDNPDSYRENLFNPKAAVLQTAVTLQLRRTHIADEERFELSTVA